MTKDGVRDFIAAEYTLSENYVHGLAAFGPRLKNFESPHSSRGSSPGLPAGNSVICLTVTLGQNYEAFLKDLVDWQGILATYIGIFIFAGVWIGYRLVLGGRFVPYAEMRFPEAEKFEKEAGKR